jgi:hypothetical protein
MATTAMNTYSYSILVQEGFHPPETHRANGEEIFPGYPVTEEGHTWPDCGCPDGLGDPIIGVAGLLENQDIGTVYANDAEFPVYRTGSGAIVRMYHGLDDGSIRNGEILVASCADDDGHVRPLKKALQDFITDGSAGTILATQIQALFSIVGRAMEAHASSGTTTPIKVLLSI